MDQVYFRSVLYLPKVVINRNQHFKHPPNKNKVGYFYKQRWIDPVLPDVARKYDRLDILKNKLIVRLGDSLSRRFFWPFELALQRSVNKHAGKKTTKDFNFWGLKEKYFNETCLPLKQWGASHKFYVNNNTTSVRITHGNPAAKNQCVGKDIFSAEVIQQMIKFKIGFSDQGANVIIIFTHAAHFLNLNKIFYYNRLIELRDAALEYKKYCPEALIMFKTLNHALGDYQELYSITSGFLAQEYNQIIYQIFGDPYIDDIRDDARFPVKVWDVYRMSLAVYPQMDKGNIHPRLGSFLNTATGDAMINLMHYIGYLN